MSEVKRLRISIWAAYDGDGPLMLATPGSEDAPTTMTELPRVASGLQREVYSWSTTEDVFGGVVNAERRIALSEALFVALQPDKAPLERGIDVLRRFTALARVTLTDGGTEWSASTGSLDDEGPRRLNTLLALAAHLDWLASVHDGQPGISVTAR